VRGGGDEKARITGIRITGIRITGITVTLALIPNYLVRHDDFRPARAGSNLNRAYGREGSAGLEPPHFEPLNCGGMALDPA